MSSNPTSKPKNEQVSLFILIGGILIFLGFVDLVSITMRHFYLRSYDNNGVSTEAIVVKKHTQYDGLFTQYFLDYEYQYQDSNGETGTYTYKEDNVGRAFYDHVDERSQIAIQYNRKQPQYDPAIEELLWRPNTTNTVQMIGFFVSGIALIGINQRKKLVQLWKSRFSSTPQ